MLEVLVNRGIKVDVANNGAEAIKLALLITVSEAGLSKKIKKK